MKVKVTNRLFSFLLAISLILMLFPQVTFAAATITDASGAIYYTVSFEPNGVAAIASQSVAADGKVTAPVVPEREGYTFAGWFTDAACKTAYDFETAVNASFTLYAGWEGDSTVILNRDFTGGLSEADLTNINSYKVGTSDGLVREPYNMADIENGANGKGLVVKTTGSSTTWSPASLIFYNGSGALTGSHYKPAGSMDLNGAIVLEAEMMFETVADTTYYPLSIVPDESGSGSIAYNYADRMIKIANGRCYINNTDVGEIKAGTYYSFKLHMQIDGDETTTNDPFIATVSDGTNTYTGSGRICHIAAGDHYETKVISYIHVLKVLAPSTVSTESPVNAYIKTLKFYYDEAPVVTSSLAEDTWGVKGGSNITLTFDQPMDTTTFTNITLQTSIGTAVSGTTVKATNSKTCVVTLPERLGSLSAYQLVVPDTVLSQYGTGTTAKTVNFTSARSNTILYRDFSNGVSDADITLMNTPKQGTADGLVSRRSTGASNGTNSLKITLEASNGIYNPPSFLFCTGGITSSQTDTRQAFLPNGDLALKGQIVLEAEMKFDTVEGVTHYPLSIVGSQHLTKTAGINFTYANRMIKIADGKCYINGTEKGTINANQYYKFKLVMNIDGDSTTTNDSFTATVTDGTNTYTGSGTVYYSAIGWDGNTSLPSIGYIHVIKSVSSSSTVTPVNIDIKTLNFYYEDELAMSDYITADVTCGTFTAGEDVSVTATFTNETSISLTPCFVAALYDGAGKLADVTVVTTETVAAGGTYEMAAGLSIPADADAGAYFVKVFAWNSLSSMQPIMTAITK